MGCFVERYWHSTDGIEASLSPHQKRLGGGEVGAALVYLSDVLEPEPVREAVLAFAAVHPSSNARPSSPWSTSGPYF